MKKNNVNISEIAREASLKILTDEESVEIKHKLRLSDKSIWGILFFLCGGIFLIIVSFVKTSDTISKILGSIIGFSILTLSILSLIREIADNVKVFSNNIAFRYNLKFKSVAVDDGQRIKMKTEIMKIRRAGTLGSDFIIVIHYLKSVEKEIPILKFQMDNSNADKAIRLGNEITRLINARLQNFN